MVMGNEIDILSKSAGRENTAVIRSIYAVVTANDSDLESNTGPPNVMLS